MLAVKFGVNKKLKAMDSKVEHFLTLSTVVELLMIIIWIYYMNSININMIMAAYLICFVMFEVILIYVYIGKSSLFPTTFNYGILVAFIFLFISYFSNFMDYNNSHRFDEYFKDFLYFISRFVFLLSHSAKYKQINYKKQLNSIKYKIHSLVFGIIIFERFAESIFNIYKDIDINSLLFLLFTKYMIDFIILYKTYKIIIESFKSPQIESANLESESKANPTIFAIDPIDPIDPINTNNTNNTINTINTINRIDPISNEEIINDNINDHDNYKNVRQRFGGNIDNMNNKNNQNNIDKTIVIPNKKQKKSNNENHRNNRSPAKSIKIINEYKGNDSLKDLRLKYKKQHQMKENKEQIIPPKPTNIDEYIDDDIRKLYKECLECFNSNSIYIGVCGDYGIEIEFYGYNGNGTIKGKRIINFNKMTKIDGNGTIKMDLIWNDLKSKYIAAVCFEYIDEYNGIKTKLQFNSFLNKIDFHHLFFEGQCFINNRNIGYFNMVCISIRRRDIINKRKTLLEYHCDQNDNIPKYIKCIHLSTQKINNLYNNK